MKLPKNIEKFLSKFPDDAKSWKDATDEIRDIARTAKEFYNDIVLNISNDDENALQALDFRKIKTASEWNTKGKEYIRNVYSKMNDECRRYFHEYMEKYFKVNESLKNFPSLSEFKETLNESEELELVFGRDYKELEKDFKSAQMKRTKSKKEYKEFDDDYDNYYNDLIEEFENRNISYTYLSANIEILGEEFKNRTKLLKILNEISFNILKSNDYSIENIFDKICVFKNNILKIYKIKDREKVLEIVQKVLDNSKTFKIFLNKLLKEFSSNDNLEFMKVMDLKFNDMKDNTEKLKEYYNKNKK